jgi:hypothetical protein
MKRAIVLNLAAVAFVAAASRAGAQTPAGASGFSGLKGTVIDSLHESPLAKAVVVIEGTGRRGLTNSDGQYAIDSVPPGKHRVSVVHPLLDTLGLTMRTPEYNFVGGTTHELDVPIPGAQAIANRICSAAMRSRGPAVLMGFVKDPDTHAPATGAKVELVYDEPDLIGRKQARVRSDLADSTGLYKICGLPKDMVGKVQVFRNGVSSGEVPAEITNGFVGLRGFSIVGQHQQVVEVKNDSGKVTRILKGSAKVTGRVLDKKGQPLKEARVALQGGTSAVVLTNANGVFTLDSLPSGTQSIQVRKLGYSVQEAAVELSAATPAMVNVTMSDAVPLLETMRVEAAADKALSDLGYLSRKQTGMGYFMDGKMINNASISFSDVMRVAPGLKIMPAGDGRSYVITDSRNAANGCVVFWVDGIEWQEMTPGDIDSYVRPDEVVAVEVYHGSSTPPQFQKAGQSSCASIVVWTQGKVSTMSKRKK